MSKTYGILALFESAPAIYQAAKKVRSAGYTKWDVFTPFPVHGLDGAMGIKRSKVPVFTFIGGLMGFTLGMTIVWYMGYLDYPLIVGGMPYYSPVFPFPVAYELTILLAAFGTLIGMFTLNKLPMHYHPVMNYEKFRHLTDDKFAVVIEAEDELFNESEVRELFAGLHPTEITVITEEEKA